MSDEKDLEAPEGDEAAEAAEADAAAAADEMAAEDGAGAEAELGEMRERWLRAAAEAQNTRKRAEKLVSDTRDYAIDGFARDLIAVADNLSRALDAASPEARESAGPLAQTLLEGVELTERSLLAAFGRHGLERIEPKGEAFDPNHHQAAAQIPSEVPSGQVAEVMQAGFLLKGRVLRPAMVAVSSGPAAEAPPDAGEAKGEPTKPAADAPPPGGKVDTKI